ncbi:MAG: ATP-dependent Clp protease ATP-binding subunit, partial [Candidatus Riesia sp.]|nr:ATP-dependent Clp protease ATP-binding subunit [Candidatus Riesia sp.]
VYNILLQIMDDGVLTDSHGKKIDFKNTVIIMTSNIGTKKIKDFGEGVGFNTKAKQSNKSTFQKKVIQDSLKKTFSPEFLNRVDDVVVFNSLEKEDILKIVDIELQDVMDRIKEEDYKIEISKKLKEFIADKGFDPQYGARPIKRSIQKYVEDPVSEEIIKGSESIDKIKLDYDDKNDKLRVRVTKRKEEEETKEEEV